EHFGFFQLRSGTARVGLWAGTLYITLDTVLVSGYFSGQVGDVALVSSGKRMKKCPTCKRQYPDQQRFCVDDQSPLYHDKSVYPGVVIAGKYRVESVINVAGMSTVYLVEP